MLFSDNKAEKTFDFPKVVVSPFSNLLQSFKTRLFIPQYTYIEDCLKQCVYTFGAFDSKLNIAVTSMLRCMLYEEKNIIALESLEEKKVIAYAYFTTNDFFFPTPEEFTKIGLINAFIIDKDYHNQNIISFFLLAIINKLESSGCKYINLNFQESYKKEIIMIFEQFGFKNTADKQNLTFILNLADKFFIDKYKEILHMAETIELPQLSISLSSTKAEVYQPHIPSFADYLFLKKANIAIIIPQRRDTPACANLFINHKISIEAMLSSLKDGRCSLNKETEFFVLAIRDLNSHEIIGALFYHYKNKEQWAEVDSLEIDKDHRKEGYGSLLLLAVIDHLTTLDCKTIKLTNTEEGTYLYLKFGFIPDPDCIPEEIESDEEEYSEDENREEESKNKYEKLMCKFNSLTKINEKVNLIVKNGVEDLQLNLEDKKASQLIADIRTSIEFKYNKKREADEPSDTPDNKYLKKHE